MSSKEEETWCFPFRGCTETHTNVQCHDKGNHVSSSAKTKNLKGEGRHEFYSPSAKKKSHKVLFVQGRFHRKSIADQFRRLPLLFGVAAKRMWFPTFRACFPRKEWITRSHLHTSDSSSVKEESVISASADAHKQLLKVGFFHAESHCTNCQKK